MRPDALASALEANAAPTIVCAQAGNVNSGAFDPLDEIAAIAKRARRVAARRRRLRAVGGRVLRRCRHHVRGVERADSWATDAHKWLNVPYDSGLVFVANPAAHRAAMSLSAAYLVRRREEPREPMDWTPESSRRARGFAVYAALRSLGRSGVADLVERCCRLARRFAERLRRGAGRSRSSTTSCSIRCSCGSGRRRRTDADARTQAMIRAGAGGTRLLAGRHALARHGRDADLGVELVDDRRGRRSVGRVDRARRAARVTPHQASAAALRSARRGPCSWRSSAHCSIACAILSQYGSS